MSSVLQNDANSPLLGSLFVSAQRPLLVFIGQRLPRCLYRLHSSFDVAQDVFVLAWKHREEFKGHSEAQLFSWLKAIAEHRIDDLYRREGWVQDAMWTTLSFGPFPPGFAEPQIADQPIDEQLSRMEDRTALRHALAIIQPPVREMLITVYVADERISEVAGAFGISRFQLRRLLDKALRELRAQLRRYS